MNWRALERYNLGQWFLRIGLAVVFGYAALGSLINPSEWIGYFPPVLTDHFSDDLLLKGHALYQLFLVAWLLSGVYLRYAALLSAATLGGILLANLAIFSVTFRDVGLFFAALALAFHKDN